MRRRRHACPPARSIARTRGPPPRLRHRPARRRLPSRAGGRFRPRPIESSVPRLPQGSRPAARCLPGRRSSGRGAGARMPTTGAAAPAGGLSPCWSGGRVSVSVRGARPDDGVRACCGLTSCCAGPAKWAAVAKADGIITPGLAGSGIRRTRTVGGTPRDPAVRP